MKTTRDRFKLYTQREKEVIERIRKLTELGAEIVKVNPAPDGATYDRVLVMPSGEVKLEIQITEAADFLLYGDVRLDFISAFAFLSDSPYRGKAAIKPVEIPGFLNSIAINRHGKLFQCEADSFAFWVTPPVDLLWLYSVEALQKNRTYFMYEYGIRINIKSADEGWQSSFVPVPMDDAILQSCGVKAFWGFENG
jgi:hypothetical protein